jgi:hypothetical protein
MRPTDTHLGLDKYGFKLTWVGMSWMNIVPIVFSSIRCFGKSRTLLLHVGGNDRGNYSTKELIKHLKFAIYVSTLYRVKLCVRVQKKLFQSTLNDINKNVIP